MSESIFPFIQDIGTTVSDSSQQMTIPREYAWDFKDDEDCIKMVDGKLQVVTGLEAIKIWAMKALRTPRYRYWAYSWNYGHDLENLVGQEFSQEASRSEAMRYIREALIINPNIQEVKNFTLNLEDCILKIECKLVTPYGEVDISV